MAKYKITCNNPKWVDDHYDELEFKAVAFTDDEYLAQKYSTSGLHTGETPLFEVEEVQCK